MAHKRSTNETTIFDVAKEAGVSYSTVSRVVNNKSYVKPETREKVLRAMEQLDYQVNLQARSLAGGQTNVIGLLTVDLVSQYTAEIFRGIDEILTVNNYELMLYTAHHQTKKESMYAKTMARGLTDGLLIILPKEPESYLEPLRERNFPFVLIDQISETSSDLTVTSANRLGGYEATKHLIELGHQRIGIITGWLESVNARDRLEGYKNALANYNIPLDSDLIFQGDYTQTKGYEGTLHFLDLPSPPSAIFSSNDIAATGVIDAANARELNIPEDLSVIGFDDIPIASIINPKLTTIRQPLQDMGSIAAQLLLERINDKENKSNSAILPIELIVRKSTAPFRK